MMKAVDGLREISTILEGCGIEDSLKEAEIIFTKCIGMERVTLYRDNPVLSSVQMGEIKRVLERRQKREPIQYIIGYVDFYGLKIKVGPGVLIPRPETELVVEKAIKAVTRNTLHVTSGDQNPSRVTHHASRKILDLCTGSGCLALALAQHFPHSEVIGTDISEMALEYARENAEINGIGNVSFIKGDLYKPIKEMRFDIIVSNPPYIKRSDIRNLQLEIREWEPVEALDGGEDGLTFYREILSFSEEHLNNGGFIVMEVGEGEFRDVATMAENFGFRSVSVNKDYSGIERVLRMTFQ